MYRPTSSTLYPLSSLPSLRNCLLAFVLGVLLAWLYSEGLLWLIPAALVALVNAIVLGVLGIVACMFIFGKAD